ncbi:MAG: acyl carrier protein [Proteobacteria bacterium]|nr:acyl carrier protein [Pseudomonadota bacterium]
MTIKIRVRDVVCQQLDVAPEQIKLETSFIDDLNADSLAVVELALALEEEFEIDIPDKDVEKLRTFGDVLEYLNVKIPIN